MRHEHKKRCGAYEPYDPGKITAAMQKAFASVGGAPGSQVLAELLARWSAGSPGRGHSGNGAGSGGARPHGGRPFRGGKKLHPVPAKAVRASRGPQRPFAAQVGVLGWKNACAASSPPLTPLCIPSPRWPPSLPSFCKARYDPGRTSGGAGQGRGGAHHPGRSQWGAHRRAVFKS